MVGRTGARAEKSNLSTATCTAGVHTQAGWETETARFSSLRELSRGAQRLYVGYLAQADQRNSVRATFFLCELLYRSDRIEKTCAFLFFDSASQPAR